MTATLRKFEENSSAKIFIADTAFGFVNDFHPHTTATQPETRNLRFAILDFIKPSFRPFDHRHPLRPGEIFLQSGANDLLSSVEPGQIEGKERQPTAVVLVNQGEGRRVHAIDHAETAGDAFD